MSKNVVLTAAIDALMQKQTWLVQCSGLESLSLEWLQTPMVPFLTRLSGSYVPLLSLRRGTAADLH